MGPPGSGNGTQARRVAQARGVPIAATGDILRQTALASTSIGRAVKTTIERGELVDDECGTNADLVTGGARQCQCGGMLRTRPDDSEAVARERLHVYERATKPLVDFYRKRPTFRRIDGTLSPERATAQIELAVDAALDNLPV